MKSLKEKIGHNPQYKIDCASSDYTPGIFSFSIACRSVYCDNPKSVKRVAGQLRRYYTSVAIKTYYGDDVYTGEPTYLIDNSSY